MTDSLLLRVFALTLHVSRSCMATLLRFFLLFCLFGARRKSRFLSNTARYHCICLSDICTSMSVSSRGGSDFSTSTFMRRMMNGLISF